MKAILSIMDKINLKHNKLRPSKDATKGPCMRICQCRIFELLDCVLSPFITDKCMCEIYLCMSELVSGQTTLFVCNDV